MDTIEQVARRHGFSREAAQTLVTALQQGQGKQAQFSHPELGGMGQWQGGMLQIGDMFNTALKARVAQLIAELVPLTPPAPPPTPAAATVSPLWGAPAQAARQNDLSYAHYPAAQRLVVTQAGNTTAYDTSGVTIVGVQAANGAVHLTTPTGTIPVSTLPRTDIP